VAQIAKRFEPSTVLWAFHTIQPYRSYYYYYIIDYVFATTVHAPYHVTYPYGVNFSHIFEIPDPDLPFTIQLV